MPEVQPKTKTGRPRGRPRRSTPRDLLAHSQAEARRRERIREGYAMLVQMVPALRETGGNRCTRSKILEEGAEYLLAQERLCKQLAAEENQKIQLQQQLQQTKQQLQAQLDALRASKKLRTATSQTSATEQSGDACWETPEEQASGDSPVLDTVADLAMD